MKIKMGLNKIKKNFIIENIKSPFKFEFFERICSRPTFYFFHWTPHKEEVQRKKINYVKGNIFQTQVAKVHQMLKVAIINQIDDINNKSESGRK